MQRQHPVHDVRTSLQILDGLEQRHDVDGAAAGGVDEADLLQQHRHLQHVGHALAHRDDALGDHVGAERGMRFGRGAEHREFPQRLLAVFDEAPKLSGRALRNSRSSRLMRASSLSAR